MDSTDLDFSNQNRCLKPVEYAILINYETAGTKVTTASAAVMLSLV